MAQLQRQLNQFAALYRNGPSRLSRCGGWRRVGPTPWRIRSGARGGRTTCGWRQGVDWNAQWP